MSVDILNVYMKSLFYELANYISQISISMTKYTKMCFSIKNKSFIFLRVPEAGGHGDLFSAVMKACGYGSHQQEGVQDLTVW